MMIGQSGDLNQQHELSAVNTYEGILTRTNSSTESKCGSRVLNFLIKFTVHAQEPLRFKREGIGVVLCVVEDGPVCDWVLFASTKTRRPHGLTKRLE